MGPGSLSQPLSQPASQHGVALVVGKLELELDVNSHIKQRINGACSGTQVRSGAFAAIEGVSWGSAAW